MAVPVALVGVDAPACQVVQQTLAASLHVFPQAASVCAWRMLCQALQPGRCVCVLLLCPPAATAGAVPGRCGVSCVQQQGDRIIPQGEPAAAKACTLDSCCSGAQGVGLVLLECGMCGGFCVHGSSLCVSVLFVRRRLLPIATLVFMHVASCSACT